MAEEVKRLVDQYEARGFMTQQEHDSLIEKIQQDGQVDDAESQQLSRIFSLVQQSKLRIVDDEEAAQKLQSSKAEPAKSVASSPAGRPRQARNSESSDEILFKNRQRGLGGSGGSLASSAMGMRSSGTRFDDQQIQAVEETVGYEKVEIESSEPEIEAPVEKVVEEKSGDEIFDRSEPSEEEVELHLESSLKRDEVADVPQASDFVLPEHAFSLDSFLKKSIKRFNPEQAFELHSDRILAVNLNGEVWIKKGSMIGYDGNIGFVREKILERGLSQAVGKLVTGEGAKLSRAKGKGRLFVADQGKKVTMLYLRGETIVVNGHDLLAFQKAIKWEVTVMKRLAAMMSGGIFNIKLSGVGMVAITTHYDPLTLPVIPGRPIRTDPRATVAWSGNLTPKFKADVQVKTMVGRGSGESLQMEFHGEGFVVVQPFEEESRAEDK